MTRAVFLAFAVTCAQAMFMQLAVAQPPPPPPPPVNADCPYKWIGQMGGLHQYETINCQDPNTTGFGQSANEYTVSQCQGATCLNPVVTILKLSKMSAEKTVCAAENLDEAKQRVRTSIAKFAVWQSRYAQSDSFWPSWLREVNENRVAWQEYLYDDDFNVDDRVKAFNAAYCTDGSHDLANDLATRNWGLRGVRRLRGSNVNDLWPLLDGYPAQVKKGDWSFPGGVGNWRPKEQRYLKARSDSGEYIYFQYVEMKKALQRFYIAFEIDEPVGADITTVNFVETGEYRHLLNLEDKTIFASTVTNLSP